MGQRGVAALPLGLHGSPLLAPAACSSLPPPRPPLAPPQKQEGLTRALGEVGCEACAFNRRDGCRHCWPEAIRAAQEEHAAVPPERRAAPWAMQQAGASPAAAAPKPEGRHEKKARQQEKKGGAAAAAAAAAGASPAEPPGSSVSPAAAAAAAGTSASTRRNKVLMAVQREAVTAAHAAGKFALGCGRCRYSLTGVRRGRVRWAAGLWEPRCATQPAGGLAPRAASPTHPMCRP